MVNTAKSRRDSSASPRASPRGEVGEIETRAPFQSVRAAVSLFDETVTSPRSTSTKKSKSQLEGVLDKEAEFHFAQKELDRCKNEVKNAESAANKALPELEKAMKTLLELKDKIKTVNASNDSITEETEALRVRVKELEEAKSSKQDRKGKTGDGDDLEACRQGFKAAAAELDAAKQELISLHRDFDAAKNAKSVALQKAEEAQLATKEHSDEVAKLSKEIERMKESLGRVNLNTRATLQEQAKVSDEKDKEERAHRTAKEGVETKLHACLQEKENEGLNGAKALELKLAETNKEIEDLKAQIAQAKEALSESEGNAYSELNAAREAFRQIERENRSIQEVEALKLELADVGKEIAETKEKEAREQSLARRVQVELQEQKLEYETLHGSKVKDTDASREMTTKLEQLFSEAKQAKEEAQEMISSTEELQREAKNAHEMEKKLEMTMKEAEEAKAAKGNAQNELKILSERKDAERAAASADRDQKKELSKEEYEALKEKASEPEKFAETKLASAMAELEALRASKNEAEKNLNESLEEIEEVARATEEAFKEAEMADTVKISMQRELRRQREKQCCS